MSAGSVFDWRKNAPKLKVPVPRTRRYRYVGLVEIDLQRGSFTINPAKARKNGTDLKS